MLLEGKTAIVTGAGSGIGAASARRFAAEGAEVVCADIRLDRAQETADAIAAAGGVASAIEVDVRDATHNEAMVDAAVERFGGVDVAFFNAGTIRPGNAVKLSEEDWDIVMDTNVKSIFLGAKYVLPLMADAGGGSIISTASVSGLRGDPSGIAYGASKAAVINLTRCLATDHAAQGIRVNCICPGVIDTPPVKRMLADGSVREDVGHSHLLDRIGQPEEIASAAVWLASNESAFVTGEALVVDGGLTSRAARMSMGDPRPNRLRSR
ncbi:MAG: SDR family oxidoreductase [Actinomycetia bacterium]|nr:SDR family oxidoreductase [Actinomycetes bacterium]MCP4226186.1 SDR family oxidoreductase [Actinomycetes bacterium]MCP5034428.1 SDR family oxidoreductase [Actinomycetes bacterium]